MGTSISRRLRDALPEYVQRLKGSGVYVDPEAQSIVRRWADRWANRRVSSIAPQEIRTYLDELSKARIPAKTVEREKLLLRSFFRFALRRGWVDADPTEGLKERVSRKTPENAVVWTPWEQKMLLEACQGLFALEEPVPVSPAEKTLASKSPIVPKYLYPLVLLALRTGLAMDDLLRLRWRHVFLDARRIRLPAAERGSARDLEVWLDDELTAALEAVLRESAEHFSPERFLFEALGLPLWKGSPHARAVLCAFRAVRRRAGIPEGEFSSLRLSFLANCARAGVPPEEAARICDWDGDLETVARLWTRV